MSELHDAISKYREAVAARDKARGALGHNEAETKSQIERIEERERQACFTKDYYPELWSTQAMAVYGQVAAELNTQIKSPTCSMGEWQTLLRREESAWSKLRIQVMAITWRMDRATQFSAPQIAEVRKRFESERELEAIAEAERNVHECWLRLRQIARLES